MRNGQNNCLWLRWAANFVSWESIKPTNGLYVNDNDDEDENL